MNPDPFTLGQLMDMAEGRWSGTANILTALFNANRDKKKKPTPFTVSDFPAPLIAPQTIQGTSIRGNIKALKVFVGEKTNR